MIMGSNLEPRYHLRVLKRDEIEWVAHRHIELSAVHLDGQNLVLFRQRQRNVFCERMRKSDRIEVDERYAKLELHDLHQLLLGDVPFFAQDLADPFAGAFLLL